MVIPIADPFLAYLKTIAPSDLDAPVFPKASAEKRQSDGESRRLSAQFHTLLVRANLTRSLAPRTKIAGEAAR